MLSYFRKEAVFWFLALFLEDIKCCLEHVGSLNECFMHYFPVKNGAMLEGHLPLLLIVIIISAQSHETFQ